MRINISSAISLSTMIRECFIILPCAFVFFDIIEMLTRLFFYVILFVIDFDQIESKFQPCEQTFGSHHYDLNQLSHLTITGQETIFQYALTPCGLVPTDQCGPTLSDSLEGMMACQERILGPGSPRFESPMGFLDGYGKTPNLEFQENTDGPGTGVIMTMRNAQCNFQERLVETTFICDKTVKNPTTMEIVEFPTCQFKIRIRAAEACPVVASGMTGGGVFIILLVIVIPLYVLGGLCYNKFKANQTGWALLPNRSFWLLLFQFFLSGCQTSWTFVRTGGKGSATNYTSV